MGKLIYSHHVSLDGYIEGPPGELDWAQVDETLYRRFNDQEAGIGAHVYGRRAFEGMAKVMPAMAQDPTAPDYSVEAARIWLAKTKVVFSRTLRRVEWGARLAKDGPGEEIAGMKHEIDKDMYLAGANLAASVIPLGLVDEYRLYVHPVLLGAGKPMFPREGAMLRLRLEEATTLKPGVVLLRYSSADAG